MITARPKINHSIAATCPLLQEPGVRAPFEPDPEAAAETRLAVQALHLFAELIDAPPAEQAAGAEAEERWVLPNDPADSG
eukprot:3979068-Amphidinium_carterae.1